MPKIEKVDPNASFQQYSLLTIPQDKKNYIIVYKGSAKREPKSLRFSNRLHNILSLPFLTTIKRNVTNIFSYLFSAKRVINWMRAFGIF